MHELSIVEEYVKNINQPEFYLENVPNYSRAITNIPNISFLCTIKKILIKNLSHILHLSKIKQTTTK